MCSSDLFLEWMDSIAARDPRQGAIILERPDAITVEQVMAAARKVAPPQAAIIVRSHAPTLSPIYVALTTWEQRVVQVAWRHHAVARTILAALAPHT